MQHYEHRGGLIVADIVFGIQTTGVYLNFEVAEKKWDYELNIT